MAYGVTKSEYGSSVIGCIFENTFTSMSAMAIELFGAFGKFSKFILRNNWPTVERIKDIK